MTTGKQAMMARKIRMTPAGLLAMPSDCDEATITLAALPIDGVYHAGVEIQWLAVEACRAVWEWADGGGEARRRVAYAVENGWNGAMYATSNENLASAYESLGHAKKAAEHGGYDPKREAAALAMLPPKETE